MGYLYIPVSILLISLFAYGISYIANKSLRLFLIIFILGLFLIDLYLTSFLNSYLIFSSLFLVLPQVFNVFRVLKLRYGRRTSGTVLKTGLTLSLGSLFVAVVNNSELINSDYLTKVVHVFAFTLGILALYSAIRHVKSSKNLSTFSDDELPTVSVLIPARNEDAGLADCIERVIASDYPKLEIIVLDDCSQDNSSEIIKSFAQKGVRFIQGEMPKDNWLAKNQAYAALAESASGDWYIFMGVDVRIGTKTIREFISLVLKNKLMMASVMPSHHTYGFNGIAHPLRAYWEASLPRVIMRYPPVLSTFWAIHDDALKSSGGFDAVSQSVVPERYFARCLEKSKGYDFYRNSANLVVETGKTYRDQLDTSVRLLYPQLHKNIIRLVLVMLLSGVVLAEAYMLINSLIERDIYKILLSSLVVLPGLASHLLITIFQGFEYKVIRTIIFPALILQEMVLAIISAYRYEFSEVLWKGRNVCYPILKVIPRLPKI